jgi:hypothetical protein
VRAERGRRRARASYSARVSGAAAGTGAVALGTVFERSAAAGAPKAPIAPASAAASRRIALWVLRGCSLLSAMAGSIDSTDVAIAKPVLSLY